MAVTTVLRRGFPMMNYEKTILEYLINKYEKSKSFLGQNKVNQSFSVKPEKLFPEYADDSEYEVFTQINEAIYDLLDKEYISVTKKKNGVFAGISLNAEKIDLIYRVIKRKPKAETNKSLMDILYRYSLENDILSKYCNEQIERINTNKRVQFFNDDLSEFENILKAVSEITKVQEETYIRDFSIRVFGDTKIFEAIKNKVIRLLFLYGDFPMEETILEELNIVKNPGHVYFKGFGIITIGNQAIDLSQLKSDIAISSLLLEDTNIKVTGKRLVTIENLTTFNYFNEADTFVMYLGGYHNSHRRNFIKKIYRQNPEIAYLHYGDIDAGGFYILLHLRNKTGINFIPYNMNIDILEKYSAYTKKLTDNDRKRLENLKNTEFSETINYMLENNCKLEQESMDQGLI